MTLTAPAFAPRIACVAATGLARAWVAACIAVLPQPATAQEWKPSRPVEHRVLAGPGAAHLLVTRTLRVLAVASARRLGGDLAEVPTWREQGVGAAYSSSQGLSDARGLRAEQIAYWEGVLRRVTATPEWAAFLARNHWKPRFMGHAEARWFLDAESASARVLLGELGLLEGAVAAGQERPRQTSALPQMARTKPVSTPGM